MTSQPDPLGLKRERVLTARGVAGEDALTGDAEGGRELDRSEGDKEGGSEEAIHLVKLRNKLQY